MHQFILQTINILSRSKIYQCCPPKQKLIINKLFSLEKKSPLTSTDPHIIWHYSQTNPFLAELKRILQLFLSWSCNNDSPASFFSGDRLELKYENGGSTQVALDNVKERRNFDYAAKIPFFQSFNIEEPLKVLSAHQLHYWNSIQFVFLLSVGREKQKNRSSSLFMIDINNN